MLYNTVWLIARLGPIKYLYKAHALLGRLARWQVLLSEYDIAYVSQKAIKGSLMPDYLASQVVDNYESLSFYFPDKDLMCIFEDEKHL